MICCYEFVVTPESVPVKWAKVTCLTSLKLEFVNISQYLTVVCCYKFVVTGKCPSKVDKSDVFHEIKSGVFEHQQISDSDLLL